MRKSKDYIVILSIILIFMFGSNIDNIFIKKMDIFQVLPLMISILQGDHVNHPAVEYIQTENLQIENLSGEEVKVDYDGEELPEGFPVNISIIPQAIQIVVPGK